VRKLGGSMGKGEGKGSVGEGVRRIRGKGRGKRISR